MEQVKTTGAVITGVLAFAAVCVAAWAGYWWLAGSSQTHRYQVNTNSQQYQGGLVSQERDRVSAYDSLSTAIAGTTDQNVKVADQQQQRQIETTFCQVFESLNPAPADLAEAHARIC